ncbi:hypothetical protein H0274_13715 [Altererythrobacter sp. CC-YST694]|uniref:hypothetical protein n=1 Tax=Altererythrobacter sp. CC-YST694 TaxID=2755038 RepID=UPI001D035B00|nr:hypothetical protein [Altererythrobacter sp. CC-YST694]MCB5426320.1 hypothetical protein [Altererythrobacter sp. CC-YST694]
MADILPFSMAAEPFARVEQAGDRFFVEFANAPKLSALSRHFEDGWKAYRHATRYATAEDISLVIRPRLLQQILQGGPR